MENEINFLNPLFEKIEDFGNTSFQLYKLKAVDKVSKAYSSTIYSGILFFIFLFFFIFMNIGLALWIGKILEENYLGFLSIACIYALLISIVFVVKKQIKHYLENKIIANCLKK